MGRRADGEWKWNSDRSTVEWSLWKSGEPDGGIHQSCAVYIVAPTDATRNKKWASMYCYQDASVRSPVVCEKARKYTIYHLTKEILE